MGNLVCCATERKKSIVLFDDGPTPTPRVLLDDKPMESVDESKSPPPPVKKGVPVPQPSAEKGEMAKYWHVLLLSCVAYLLLAGSSTFVPAVIMADVGRDLGMSLTQLGSLSSAGAGLKSVLIMFFMGPAIEKFGPHTLINVCIVGQGICNVLLSLQSTPGPYIGIFMANYVFNSFSEQPAFIVLYATYFEQFLAICTTAIACAFSAAGFVLPLLLSPLLVAFGWRTLWNVLAVVTLGLAPFCCCLIRAG